MTQIIDIIKTALNLGLIFLDIVESLKGIFEAFKEKFQEECAEATT